VTGLVWPLSTITLLATCSLAALAAYSLREYSRSKLEELGRTRGNADRVNAIFKQDADALLSVEIARLLLLLSLAVVAVRWQQERLNAAGGLSWTTIALESLGFTLAVVLAVVVLPWTLGRAIGERFLYAAWPVVSTLKTMLVPLVALAHGFDGFVRRAVGVDDSKAGEASAITEEIRAAVDEGQREGVIESEAGSMIQGVMELQEIEVSAILTPRTDMVTLPMTASLEDARLKFLEAGHSRIPVIGETTDDILGILYAKDLLRHIGPNATPVALRDILREPLYVPEATGTDTLLETMKRQRVHFAIVIDEYGGVAGLVTMEDVLEQIVGKIGDEHDSVDEEGVFPIGPGVIEVAAWVRIEDLNEQFGFDLPEDEDYDTLGGFVFSQLGRIPTESESFTWKNLRLIVLAADRRRIDKVRIEADKALTASVLDEA
jgi:putative hemolysin